MTSKNTYALQDYGALLFVGLLPLSQQWSTYALVIWGVLALLEYRSFRWQNNIRLLVLPLMYLLYGFSLLYSEQLRYLVLERKLSLLVIPLLFAGRPLSASFREQLIRVFVLSCSMAGAICLLHAGYQSVEWGEGGLVFHPNLVEGKTFFEAVNYGGNYFFGKDFSIIHQTVYFALYLNISLAFLVFRSGVFSRGLHALNVVFQVLLLFLISNKAGLLLLFAVLLLKIFSGIRGGRSKKWGALLAVVLIGVLLAVNPRFHQSVVRLGSEGLRPDPETRYGYGTRVLSWTAAMELIGSNLWGYGTGDAQERLNEVYQEKGYIWPLKQNYNAHNQYLQIWLEVGVHGLLVYGIAVFFFYYPFEDKRMLWFSLAVCVIIAGHSLFESILNRYSGLAVFALIFTLINTGEPRYNTSIDEIKD